MKSISSILSAALLFGLAIPQSALAQAVAGAPATIDYQSQVLDSAGNVLAPTVPANYTMQFRIYTAQTGGTIVWAESQIVSVDKGAFSVRLGTGVRIPAAGGGNEGTTADLRQAFNGIDRFLGLTVTIPSQTPVEIVPRLAFLSSPFSLVAEHARVADSVSQTSGTSLLGTTTITNLTLSGPMKVNAANTLEFGAGVSGKEVQAGKIGYGVFTPDTLDIVGAGTTPTTRKVKIFAEGGLTVTGGITASGGISTNGTISTGGNMVAAAFSGNGSNLADIQGANIQPGTVSLNALVAAVKESLCPVGTISAFAGDTAPAGWLLCNGASVSRTTYATLFSVIGQRFGSNGVATNFNVPDFRGRFLRGRDGGAGNDPDRATRTAMTTGGAAGDNVGSLQTGQFASHTHSYKDVIFSYQDATLAGAPSNLTRVVTPKAASWENGLGTDGSADTDNYGWEWNNRVTVSAGGNETRPINISVNYIIKY